MASYTPNKGDFVILSFDPQSGHEQKGRRPALVVSNRLFNQHTGLALVCPLTNTARRNPFHVAVPSSATLSGFIMVEQVKSVDFRSRAVEFVEQAPKATLDDVLGLLDAIIYQ